MTETSKKPRTIMGEVVSDRMDKTIVVSVTRTVPHPKYGKYVKRRTKLFAHDPENSAHVGDIALIQANRPLSKKKNWVLVRTVQKNDAGMNYDSNAN